MALNILIISSEFPPGPGGIGKHAYSLAKGLVSKGINVFISTDMDYSNEKEINEFISKLPLAIRIFRIQGKGIRKYISRTLTPFRLLRKHHFDKIIVTGKSPIWIGGIMKTIFRKKFSFGAFVHGSEVHLPGFIERSFVIYSLRILDEVWAVSSFTKGLLENKIEGIKVIPNGLNIDDWPTDPKTIMPFDSWKGYPKLLTVGNITARKGQHRVVTSLPLLLTYFPDIHYHLVGLPTNSKSLIDLAVKLKVDSHITIHGVIKSQEDLQRAYRSSDIFCMLSENQNNGDVEGFGIAILEANVMGIPVIGSRESGIVDAVNVNVTGFLIDGSSSWELLESVKNILVWNKQKTYLNCISWAKEFDWSRLANLVFCH